MTIHVGRYAGHVTLTSTETGRIAAVTVAEWRGLVARVLAGHLDYTLTPTKAVAAPVPVAPATPWPPNAEHLGRGASFPVDPATWPRLVGPAPITDPALREDPS